MSVTSTPLKPVSKKRELSSPEELSELKKNKIEEMMAESVGTSTGTSTITLQENDLKTIADFLKDAFETKLTEMTNTIVTGVLEGLQNKVSKLEKENKDLRERVEKLEAKADAAEQYSRRNCLRIAGVPENQAADTDGYVLDLSRAIGAEIALTDIERSHRVGRPSAGRTRDIIVKFASYRTRRMVYGARTTTKDSGYVGVYINEDLTKPRNKLLLKARKMVKTKLLKSAWSSDGNILVRDGEEEKHRITSESDLAVFGPVPKLFGETDAAGTADEAAAPHAPMD